MIATARHQHILSALRKRGSLSSAALRRELGTTAMTVWRDFKTLEELGLLRRVRGGASLAGLLPGEPDYEEKHARADGAKRRIAAFAATEFVREGDTVALEGGTTVAALLDFLPRSRISILTNSLPVALRARSVRPECPVRIAGGWLSRISGNTSGPETVRAMEKWRSSVCFISATGFDAEVGPSDPNPLEIEAKRALVAGAKQTVLLLDSSKFGRRSAAVTLHPRRLAAIVTDAKPGNAILAAARKNGVRICVAGK